MRGAVKVRLDSLPIANTKMCWYCDKMIVNHNFEIHQHLKHGRPLPEKPQKSKLVFMAAPYGALYQSTRKNAAKRRIEFALLRDEFMQIVERAQGACEVSGLPFGSTSNKLWDRNPYGASIDRIDCRKGYTFSNCRLVCVVVNFAMNTWGESVLVEIAEGICFKRLKSGLKFAIPRLKVKHEEVLELSDI